MKKYLLVSLMFLGSLVSINNVSAGEIIIPEDAKIIISSPNDGEILSGTNELNADISSLIKLDEANLKLNYKFWYSNVLISRTDPLAKLNYIGDAKCNDSICSLNWDTNSISNGSYNIIATASVDDSSESEGVDSNNIKVLFSSDSVSVTIKNEVAVTYTLKYTAGNNGTIEGNINQIVDQDEEGTAVTAIANSGFHFENWSDEVTTASRTDDGTENIDVTANFAVNKVTLTYVAGENGTISGNLSQEIYQNADSEEVTAIANAGYVFENWSDGVETPSRIDKEVSESKTITANFKAKRTSRSSGSTGSYVPKPVVVSPVVTTPIVGQVLGAEKFIFTKFLKTGSVDNEVLELQKFLNANNFVLALTGPGSVGNETTKFGSLTRQAVIKFQISRGLVGDGQVGAKTRAELNK